jgi:hypothetical protein
MSICPSLEWFLSGYYRLQLFQLVGKKQKSALLREGKYTSESYLVAGESSITASFIGVKE